MTQKCRMLNAECGMNAAASVCAHREHPASSNQHPVPRRRGLTLIELLVTIVIMVTVLAGVLPLVSPNNNARKLREASRQLNSLLAQAQAQAARDGRPVGVAFREFDASRPTGPYSGMALEAYTIAEPPPFAGFSEHSRVTVVRPPDDKLTYGKQEDGNAMGNQGEMFDPRYRGAPIWQLIFWLYDSEDLVPPRMLRNGDTINVDGNYFLIVDDPGNSEGAHQIDQETGYVVPTSRMFAIWLNNDGQQLAIGARKTYSFARQPVNTSEQPLQFPRGVGIDMEASGADGVGTDLPMDFDAGGANTVGVMFSPNGSLDVLYFDGTRKEGVEQVFFLLGLVENGNGNGQDKNDYDFAANQPADAADVTARRGRVNWLNADSRWVSVNRAGRIITTENNISFEPWKSPYIDNLSGSTDEKIDEQRRRQIVAARELAKNMSGSTGR